MWNYNLHKPLTDRGGYDYVVERKGLWKKIQIKNTKNSTIRLSRNGALGSIHVNKEYEEGDFDYICVCSGLNVYVVPFRKLNFTGSFTFSQYPEYCYDLTNPETYTYRPNIVQ